MQTNLNVSTNKYTVPNCMPLVDVCADTLVDEINYVKTAQDIIDEVDAVHKKREEQLKRIDWF